MSLIFPNESYAIKGAAIEVHKRLGCGFLEKVYQEALEEEFKFRNIPYEREKHINIKYRDKILRQDYYADFVCYGKIIVELKALKELDAMCEAQVINYLRATDLQLGLLYNFGEESLVDKRILNYYYFRQHKSEYLAYTNDASLIS